MKSIRPALPLLAVCLCLTAWAEPSERARINEARRNELRVAVEAHRAAKRDEVRREEAAAGRRLTAAELAELREQVRQQWLPHGEVVRSAESLQAERLAPGPSAGNSALAAPRSERP